MVNFYVYIHRTGEGDPFYVGKGHGSRAWSKHGRNPFWKKMVAKHGFKVEIVAESLTEEQAFFEEIKLIKQLKEQHRLCNLTDGGEGNSGWIPSQEVRNKISSKNKGKRHSSEAKLLISASSLGRKHSEKTKELIKSKWYQDHPKHKKCQHVKKSPVYSKVPFVVFKITGEFVGKWSSKTQCSKDLKISAPNICNCLLGKRQSHCGLLFRLVE
jgi:hypothetical protein